MKDFLNYHKFPLLFIFSTFGLFFIYIFSQIIILNSSGLYFGHPNVWSDWALHTGIANIFAYKSPQYWFSYHPLFSQGKFTYPFLTDMLSGMLIRIGFSLPLSFIIPSIIFSFMLLVEIYFIFYLLFNSRKIPVLTIFIFIFSSGLGFINFVSDLIKNPNINMILYPIKEYSRIDSYDWYTGNVVVGLLVPQRAFLLGMALGLISILGVIIALKENKIKRRTKNLILFFSGLIAGILPITHPHSFIAVVFITGFMCLFNLKKNKNLFYYIIPATVISLILFKIFIAGGIQIHSFFTFDPGWTSHSVPDFFHMWILFWGAMIPVSIIGYYLILRKKDNILKLFFLPFFILFILGNLFLFQPINWDNTKIFWWAYLGFSGLASFVIVKYFKKNLLTKILLIILLVSLTFTGAIELIRFSRIDKNTYLENPRDDINLGLAIRAETKPLDVFLTAPAHNHFIMVWAARPIVMGYTAWVWNFGFDYTQTYKDISLIYKGSPKTIHLLIKYNIRYVVIGPGEIDDMNANMQYFKSHYPVAFSNNTYEIFDVSKKLNH